MSRRWWDDSAVGRSIGVVGSRWLPAGKSILQKLSSKNELFVPFWGAPALAIHGDGQMDDSMSLLVVGVGR